MAVLVIKSFKEDNKHNIFDLFDIEDAVYDGLNRNNEEYETYSIDENKLSFYKNRDYLFHNPELIVSLYEKMIRVNIPDDIPSAVRRYGNHFLASLLCIPNHNFYENISKGCYAPQMRQGLD